MNGYSQFCKPTLSRALSSLDLDKIFHKANGEYLYYLDSDDKERQVLDLLGGYGAVLLGHNNLELVDKARRYFDAQRPIHNQFSIKSGAAELTTELNPVLQEETAHAEDFLFAFTNSGAESVEVALKHAEMARNMKLTEIEAKLNFSINSIKLGEDVLCEMPVPIVEKFGCEKILSWLEAKNIISKFNEQQLCRPPLFIALKHAFHGKLTSSIQLTYGEMYRKPFRRIGLPVRFMTVAEMNEYVNNAYDVEMSWLYEPKLSKGSIRFAKHKLPVFGAILVEPVQGEGGVYCLENEDAKMLHHCRDVLDCPLIADEVQSGLGRCGSFLAGSQIGLQPDYIVLSKALGGGIAKIGVVAIRRSVYVQGFDLIQSSTFGEDDFSTTIALAVVRMLTRNDQALIKRTAKLGASLKNRLLELQQKYPDIIQDVRGKGLLLGVQFTDQSNAHSHIIKTMGYQGGIGYLVTGFLLNERDIRVAPPASAGDVMRIEPTIDLKSDQISHLMNALDDFCNALRYQDSFYILRFLFQDRTKREQNAIEPVDYRSAYDELNIPMTDTELDKDVIKVAFINHLISADWLIQVDPSLKRLSKHEAEKLLHKMDFDRRSSPFPPMRINSAQGKKVDFILYPISITSSQIEHMIRTNELEQIRKDIDERISAAKDDGCKIAGLGMFTSIVTNNGKSVKVPGIGLTTGNALTVAMSAKAIDQTIGSRYGQVGKVAVIGAAGNIASVYASLLTEKTSRLCLIGSGRNGSLSRLLKVAYRLYEEALLDILAQKPLEAGSIADALLTDESIQNWITDLQSEDVTGMGKILYEHLFELYGENTFITVSNDIKEISDADVILCAANSAESFIEEPYLKKNVIICDIAVPHNISQDILDNRPDITCIRGGIVQTPNGESLDPRARAYLNKGQVYACMAETAVLGLEQYEGNYSYGNLEREQVKSILAMASKHKFSLSEAKQTESM